MLRTIQTLRAALFLGLLSCLGGSTASGQGTQDTDMAFIMEACERGYRWVFGVIGPQVDLASDSVARALLAAGAEFAQENCYRPPTSREGGYYNITVRIHRGEPRSLSPSVMAGRDEGTRYRQLNEAYPGGTAVRGRNYDATVLSWREFANYAGNRIASERQSARRAAEATAAEAQRRVAEEASRQAEARRQREMAERSSTFVRTHAVRQAPTVRQLTANPFVLEGQVVAVSGRFERMGSGTVALFSDGAGNLFQISGVPLSRFTESGQWVLVAGRVLGNVQVTLPVLGMVSVPHLAFVGSAVCSQSTCSDYRIVIP